MNNIMLRIKKKMVNKKANTRRLKYESLLEEVKNKNQEIIDLLYKNLELEKQIKEYENIHDKIKTKINSVEEANNLLREKNAELLKENEKLRKKKQ